jgi:threonine synthase
MIPGRRPEPWPFCCTGCARPYPDDLLPYRCPSCGGVYDFTGPLAYQRPIPLSPDRRGLARFRASLLLAPGAPLIGLGEGGTPLLPVQVGSRVLHFKCEHLNPTGSYKDRGTAVLISALSSSGVTEAVEDSSGNAGASFAAYAARAGVRARVFVPSSASGPKRSQIEAYGAELVLVEGPRSAASEAVRGAADGGGVVYASHAYLPHGMAGVATIAYEIVEQLGRAPGAVLAPVGHGGLLVGLHRGFDALLRAGAIAALPRMVGVQAQACAPVWAVYKSGGPGLSLVQEGETRAEGIRVRFPVRGDAVLRAVEATGGTMVAVSEEELLHAWDVLGRAGINVEPTSAVVWTAVTLLLGDLPDPAVAILTGSGFKASLAPQVT